MRPNLAIYSLIAPDAGAVLNLADFVTEESGARYAICRATFSADLVSPRGAMPIIPKFPGRYRADLTSDGNTVVVILGDKAR